MSDTEMSDRLGYSIDREYFNLVKAKLNDEGEYNKFVEIIGKWKNEEIDCKTAMEHIARLLKRFTDLIDVFNDYLPTGYRFDNVITIQPKNDPPKVEDTGLPSVDDYFYLEKSKFKDQPHVYNELLAMIGRKRECNGPKGLMDQVVLLFKGDSKLIYGVNSFQPELYSFENQVVIHAPYHESTFLDCSGIGLEVEHLFHAMGQLQLGH